LEEVERDIAAVAGNDPLRVNRLYEAFIAACYMKADEIDSEWEFSRFIAELACGWIRARQAGDADRGEAAKTLLSWIDRDDYGFFNDLGSDAAKVLDRAGLEAIEKEVVGRFEAVFGSGKEQTGNYVRDQWAEILRSVYARQCNVGKYLGVTERTALTPADCATIASIYQAKRKLNDALAWIERGIEMQGSRPFQSDGGHNLAGMRRALLKKLGRGQEALESAWAQFEKRPGIFAYEELMRYVPKPDRSAWHEKAMAAEHGDLAPLIELCLKVKETGPLAKRLERASDRQLEGLSHYATEPAARAFANLAATRAG
jgi:hypothetical protein